MRRWKLTVAGAITAFFAFGALAFGAGPYPFRLASAASIFQPAAAQQTLATVQYQYGTPPGDQYGTPPADQYGARADVCIDGIFQMRLSRTEADQLIGRHAAVLGRCSGPHRTPNDVAGPANESNGRLNVCIGGMLEVRASNAEADKLVGDGVAVRGRCGSD
ncbi:MAG TPA: hypothetical protein VHZ75_11365 [Solirubrobacteraceae bacterium]|jgi:hypothetical protein|nr:hypothetical protein [Solirubrobacteraceae bacterium]